MDNETRRQAPRGRGLPKIDTKGVESFIPEDAIHAALAGPPPDAARVRDVIAKSLDKKRLEPDECAVLLKADAPALVEEILEGARTLKQRIYGNRIVLFAPLYIGNECVNNCAYCGFRASNAECVRNTLSMDALRKEVEALEDKGQKRLILVYGEHPMYDAEFIRDTVRLVYSVKKGRGEIRRVNINAAPQDVEGYRIVKSAGIGTFQVFQETYHRPTYAAMHPSGPKSDFLWRLSCHDRAMEAGIDDVGIGALMGLYDWRFEVMGLLHHAIHLERRFNCGPHTISFPRVEPAIGTDLASHPPHKVSDDDFKRLVAILRLAVPYTGLILTCREPVHIRNEVLNYGVSQIDAGSSIGVGSYAAKDPDSHRKSQFVLGDQRALDEVIRELCHVDYTPSFCTACYRLGRTGEHFMEFAIPGFVKRFCSPNAVLTTVEYLLDYGSEQSRQAGLAQVDREIARVEDPAIRRQLVDKIARLKAGERDLYF